MTSAIFVDRKIHKAFDTVNHETNNKNESNVFSGLDGKMDKIVFGR